MFYYQCFSLTFHLSNTKCYILSRVDCLCTQ